MSQITADGEIIRATIYGKECDCRLLKDHGAGTVDVERLSDGQCFRVSGLTIITKQDCHRAG